LDSATRRSERCQFMQTNGGFRWMVLKNSLMQNMRIEFL
jgi:hypothetical protein